MNTLFSQTIIDRIDDEARSGKSKSFEELCEISPQVKSNWRRRGIPAGYIKFLKLAKKSAFVGLSAIEELENKSRGRK